MTSVKGHPYRTALIVLAIGIVSEVLGSAVPPQGPHEPVSAIFWLLIPLLAVISAITLTVYGLVTRKAPQHNRG
jgi:hypothetical protein